MTTLSRLSFWLPAEQMTRFEAAYRKRLSPLLGQRELVEFSAPMTSSIEGVFSRLFEVAGPADISATEQTLLSDPRLARGPAGCGYVARSARYGDHLQTPALQHDSAIV